MKCDGFYRTTHLPSNTCTYEFFQSFPLRIPDFHFLSILAYSSKLVVQLTKWFLLCNYIFFLVKPSTQTWRISVWAATIILTHQIFSLEFSLINSQILIPNRNRFAKHDSRQTRANLHNFRIIHKKKTKRSNYNLATSILHSTASFGFIN